MKNILVRFLVVAVFFPVFAFAQKDVSGEWYGVGYVKQNGEHHSYLAEMVLRQKGNKVTGTFNYYFKSDSFSTTIKGVYHAEKRWLELSPSSILNYVAKNKNGAECRMEGDFTLMASALETSLTGQFNPIYEDRLLCPAITIKFIKYVPDTAKPEAPVDTIDEAPPVIVKKDTVVLTPVKKDTLRIVTIKKDTIVTKPAKPIADTMRPVKVKTDTVKASIPIVRSNDTAVKAAPKPVAVIQRTVNPNEKFIRELYRRSFEPVAPPLELPAETDSITINFYDNGEIDNDTISVFFNRKPLLLAQMLSSRAITLRVRVDTSVNEISMFADNLGRIPPNTAIAIVTAGDQRFELTLSSSMLSNATIRFRKKPTKPRDPKNIN